MKIIAFLLLAIAAVKGQTNVNTVCANVVNQLDCRTFPVKPLCASDGVQYKTECEFAKAHCLNSGLKVINEGVCGGNPPVTTQQTIVTTPGGPVTITIPPDVTGTVVPNPSSTPGNVFTDFGTASTPDSVTAGPATTPMPQVTTQQVNPVTTFPASSHQTVFVTTYPPFMTTRPNVGNGETTTDPYLTDVCNQVVNTPCGDDNNPLCATDGKTYRNYCMFSQARCYLPGLSLAYGGQCTGQDTFPPLTTQRRTTPPPSVFDVICRTLQLVTCTASDVSVCTNKGAVFPSACDFEKAKCNDVSLVIQEC